MGGDWKESSEPLIKYRGNPTLERMVQNFHGDYPYKCLTGLPTPFQSWQEWLQS